MQTALMLPQDHSKTTRRALLILAARSSLRVTDGADGTIEVRLGASGPDSPPVIVQPWDGRWFDHYTGRDGRGILALCREFGVPFELAAATVADARL
jgi:hypothetical protein